MLVRPFYFPKKITVIILWWDDSFVAFAQRRVEASQTLGRHRWVIERTFAWINRYHRLVTRYEHRSDIHYAFTALACSLICFNKLRNRF